MMSARIFIIIVLSATHFGPAQPAPASSRTDMSQSCCCCTAGQCGCGCETPDGSTDGGALGSCACGREPAVREGLVSPIRTLQPLTVINSGDDGQGAPRPEAHSDVFRPPAVLYALSTIILLN